MPANGALGSALDDTETAPASEPPNGATPEQKDGLATIHRVASGFHNGHAGKPAAGASLPPPIGKADLAPEPGHELASLAALDAPHDPLPAAFDPGQRGAAGSDYWAADSSTERARVAGDGSRALVAVGSQSGASLSLSPWVFIAATAVNTIVAAVLAVVITLGMARRDAVPAETPKVVAALAGEEAKAQAKAKPMVPSPLELPPLGSAKEPLRLEAMKPGRLPFDVRPPEALEESYIMVLRGLPANVTISGGGAIRLSTETWHLPPGALGKLEIVVPEWSATVFEIGVELRRTDGAVAAQGKLWLEVPPPPAPKAARLDEEALKELVRSGDKHLSRGDVAAARAIYERAAAMGSSQAALGMGTTYDQRRLWALGVFGMIGNKERARHWYQRADELGHPEAKARLANLN